MHANFQDMEEVVVIWLKEVLKMFLNGIEKLVGRSNKCLEKQGYHIEK
jgi:hypothetical protein